MKNFKILLLILISFLNSCHKNLKQKEVLKTEMEYYNNGNVEKIFFKNSSNQFEGEFKGYYENGNINTLGQFVNGKQDGIWNSYYFNGKLMSESVFDKGKLINLNSFDKNGLPEIINGTGEAKLYNKDGTLSNKISYKNSKLESVIYYKNGNIQVVKYKDGKLLENKNPLPAIGSLIPVP